MLTTQNAIVAALWLYNGPLPLAIVTIVAIWTWKLGSGPERALVITLSMLGSWEAMHVLSGAAHNDFVAVSPFHVMINLAGLIGVTVVALRANRFYPLAIAAALLISMVSHVVRVSLPGLSPWSYATLGLGPCYLIAIFLIAGTWQHRRYLRRYGPYPDWRSS